MSDPYNPGTCDLCGSRAATPVVTGTTGRIMRSDRVILPGRLCKLQCSVCGLVRAGAQEFGDDLTAYYSDNYDVGAADHLFYTPGGPVARSVAIADWMTSVSGNEVWQRASVVAEVGAGSGHLLRELSRRFPHASFIAVEPGRDAAARTAALGFQVCAGVEDVRAGSCDIVVATAVLEHVASPTAFLIALRSRLNERGTLILTQPTQDVASYDVLFADHLHHFGTAHLRAYARKCGFREVHAAVGHPLMPNFSLHVWQPAEPSDGAWQGAPATTRSAASATQVMADMARLDSLLERCAHDGRRLAAFGVHEVFAVARAYSGLGAFPIVCGLDDEPEQRGRPGFPIVRPEDAHTLGVTDALLTMNTVHYPVAIHRLDQLGIRPHPVLTQ